MQDDIETNFTDYVKVMLKHNGVSVLTVKDGWVFTFTKEKLLSLISGLEDTENITIFVRSSEGLPVN